MNKNQEIWKRISGLLKNSREKEEAHVQHVVDYMQQISESESLDKDVFVTAAILHDIGWSLVSEEDKKNFTSVQARINHMKLGAEFSEKLLSELNYPKAKIKQIVLMIAEHDNPSIGLKYFNQGTKYLREADRLWMISKTGFWLDVKRFDEKPKERLKNLKEKLREQISTKKAKEILEQEISEREKEAR